ncbi:MAG: homogentisate 1,2-dioxygenase [Kofleriaceae bacterium]|nr:homogentisate 1,2-dioxygenase [Kofleriaceae bacterium]
MTHGWSAPGPGPADDGRALAGQRHYRSGEVGRGGAPVDAFVPLLWNADLCAGVAFPDRADPVYVANGDGDTLIYVHEGGGLLRSALGDLRFGQGDYAACRGRCSTASCPTPGPSTGSGSRSTIPPAPAVAQPGRPAPHGRAVLPPRLRRPEIVGPLDEGVRELAVKRGGRWHGFAVDDSPLDVVGWDGTVYPWAFPDPRLPAAGVVGAPAADLARTSGARGALVCSFVPRLVDFAPDAIPVRTRTARRRATRSSLRRRQLHLAPRRRPGSISHHPAGIPHGPHPAATSGRSARRAPTSSRSWSTPTAAGGDLGGDRDRGRGLRHDLVPVTRAAGAVGPPGDARPPDCRLTRRDGE